MKRNIITIAAALAALMFGFVAGRFSVIGWQRVPGNTSDAQSLGLSTHFVQRLGPFDVFRRQTDYGDAFLLAHLADPRLDVSLPCASNLQGRYKIDVGPYYTYLWNGEHGNTYVAANTKGAVGEQLQDRDGDGVFELFIDQTGCAWTRIGTEPAQWERKSSPSNGRATGSAP